MMLGMSLENFTLFHVVISLVGIATGIVVLLAMPGSRRLPGWTAVFLATTVATSVTGFMFPLVAIGPPHIIGAISLVILALALFALYVRRLAGSWRWVYVVTATVALYLNVFVAVVQAFQKIPAFNALAPTQAEPPFLVAQSIVLAAFVWFGVIATRRFRPAPAQLA